MNWLWDMLRRIGTSFMLVAALAFAFHNAAVAANLDSLHDGTGHVHANSAHEHADAGHGHDHHRASAAQSDDPGAGHKDGCKTPCCGSGCTTALLAAPVLWHVDAHSVSLGFPPPQDVHPVPPDGLKRPPRSPLAV